MHYLAWHVLRVLHHAVCVRLHHLLPTARLTRHCLTDAAAAALATALAAYCSRILNSLAVNRGPHPVVLSTAEHTPRVVKVVGSEGKAVQVRFVRHGASLGSSLARVLVGLRRVARVGLLVLLLLILQVAFHK